MVNRSWREVRIRTVASPQGIARRDQSAARPTPPIQPPRSQAAFGVGVLLSADIGISRLDTQNSDLLMELETRKLVERGKGILQRELGLSEHEPFLALQRQSQQKMRPMKEIAQAIILSTEVKHSVGQN
jgi:AmiR/NasT family two-component response regulator